MTANFCLSGSLQSTQPGQLNGIMVLYSTESQFKPPVRRGGRREKKIFISCLVQFLLALIQMVEFDKGVYIVVPIDFDPSVKPLKWQPAYSLPGLPEPALFIYVLTAHNLWRRQNSVQGLNSPSQGTGLGNRAVSLQNCRLIGCVSFD